VEWKSWPLPARLNNIYSKPPLPRGLLYYYYCPLFFFLRRRLASLVFSWPRAEAGGTQHSIDGGHQPCVSPDQTRSVLCAACFNAIGWAGGPGWSWPAGDPDHHLPRHWPTGNLLFFQRQSCSILCAGKSDINRRDRHVWNIRSSKKKKKEKKKKCSDPPRFLDFSWSGF
jgi:hypothetical protein